jgi:type I restriction enzyme M protein
MVRCVKPDPRVSKDFVIDDPACGTGGFLIAAYEWLKAETGGAFDRDTAKRVRASTYYGQELVARPRRLALMNLYLHQVEPQITLADSIYEVPSPQRYDVILTNPPFGTKGANQAPQREDFVVQTSNKQLNFIQHVLTILKPGGRAAIVAPDNVLFAQQAGEVFKVLMEDCNVHTVIRCPRGTFSPYTEGTKTNVVFFTKGLATERVWIYDARANVPKITKKSRPLTPHHFAEFERCFGKDPNGGSKRSADDSTEDRWRSFNIDEVRHHHYKLDAFKWLRDEEAEDPEDLPEPEELITETMEELQLALDDLSDIQRLLEGNGAP